MEIDMRKYIALFINGLLLGGLLVGVPTAYYLGYYEGNDNVSNWRSLARVCNMNVTEMMNHIKTISEVETQKNKG